MSTFIAEVVDKLPPVSTPAKGNAFFSSGAHSLSYPSLRPLPRAFLPPSPPPRVAAASWPPCVLLFCMFYRNILWPGYDPLLLRSGLRVLPTVDRGRTSPPA